MSAGTGRAYEWIRLDRPCETATRFGLDMVRAVRLSEGANTNPVLATCPDLYLFGTLMEAAPFLRDVELLSVFSARYAAALAEANALEARPLGELVGVHLHGAHLQHELAVGLVGAVFPGAARLHHHADTVARLEGRHALHGGAEIRDVQTLAKAVRQ